MVLSSAVLTIMTGQGKREDSDKMQVGKRLIFSEALLLSCVIRQKNLVQREKLMVIGK